MESMDLPAPVALSLKNWGYKSIELLMINTIFLNRY